MKKQKGVLFMKHRVLYDTSRDKVSRDYSSYPQSYKCAFAEF